MNECDHLSDRMPDVLRHGARWSPEETAHLASCADCRTEWELMLAARSLEALAPTISDPGAHAARLQRRLAEARAARARVSRAWKLVGSAAAAAAILAAVLIDRDDTSVPAPAVAGAEALVPLPELEGLESAQLDTLLRSLDGSFAGSSPLDASTLGEDEDGELERVFATWEG
jgi:hypothetical protein